MQAPHFADDANLLYINESVKKLNKAIDSNLKNLPNCINANKISLNVSKTELILFKPKMKKLDFDLKLKISGKRLYPIKSVKYLGIRIDEHLTSPYHKNDFAIRLNRAMIYYLK